jgi:hypothetical protein
LAEIINFPYEKINPLSLESLVKRFIKNTPDKYACPCCKCKKTKRIASDEKNLPIIIPYQSPFTEDELKIIFRVCTSCNYLMPFVLNMFDSEKFDEKINPNQSTPEELTPEKLEEIITLLILQAE